jgi:protein-tyrosine-phosphatase/predicted ATP-grasp superfamily ATP-dependent carboligase
MAPRGRVLVLDGDRIPALDIVRSLGRTGLHVSVAASTPEAIAFSSRYAHARLQYPDPAPEYAPFIDWLEGELRRHQYDLVIPVTDLTTVPISKQLKRLQPLAALAAESYDKLRIVCDKNQTLELAGLVGVPCPATVVVHDATELDRCAASLSFPVVCKPLTSSVWSVSGFVSRTVFYAVDQDELRREVSKALAAGPVMLQEYRKGIGVGIEVLARSGQLLQVFQHQRLHELPLTGGGSTYRVSVPVDPLLHDYASRLLGALGWTGVAMVEFRVDPGTRDVSLMEINGRFWGSLPLSSRAGMSFAADLYRMMVLGVIPVARAYAPGVRCRKLSADLEWCKEALTVDPERREVKAGLVRKPSRGAVLGDAIRMLLPTERYDVQMLSDLRPGFHDLRRTIAAQLPIVRRPLARLLRALRSAAYCARHRTQLTDSARRAEKVLFVCYGNILRSPFASSYLRVKAAAEGRGIAVRSTGIYHRVGRGADPRGIAAGRRWDVDLSSHRSTRIDEELVRWADLILVMDRRNLGDMRREFPAAAHKTFMLGAVEPGSATDVEIPDPFAGDYALTEQAYARIAGAVDRLALGSAR